MKCILVKERKLMIMKSYLVSIYQSLLTALVLVGQYYNVSGPSDLLKPLKPDYYSDHRVARHHNTIYKE